MISIVKQGLFIMSRAPPTTQLANAPVISTTAEPFIDSSAISGKNTTKLQPKIYNVVASTSSENLLDKFEIHPEFQIQHTAPIKSDCEKNSCSSDTVEVEIDPIVALTQTALDGDTEAQNKLGLCYLNGVSVDKSYSRSVAWFRKAARKENKGAQANLSIAYKEGHGVKKDLTLATYWLLKSCSTDGGRTVTISFHRDLIKYIAPVLVEFPEFRHLKKIEFHRLGLSGEGMPAIANLIQANPAIETLDLSGNDIDDADALLLVSSLENNTNLRRLIFNTDGVDPVTLARIDTLLSQYSAYT
jgi:hypothetical protein